MPLALALVAPLPFRRFATAVVAAARRCHAVTTVAVVAAAGAIVSVVTAAALATARCRASRSRNSFDLRPTFRRR